MKKEFETRHRLKPSSIASIYPQMGRLIDGFYFGPLSIRKPALPRLGKPWIKAPCQLWKILKSEAGCYLKCLLISTPSILVLIGDCGKRNGKGGVLTSIAKSYSVKLCFIKNVMLFLCRELADPRHSVLFIFWYPKRRSSFQFSSSPLFFSIGASFSWVIGK